MRTKKKTTRQKKTHKQRQKKKKRNRNKEQGGAEQRIREHMQTIKEKTNMEEHKHNNRKVE